MTDTGRATRLDRDISLISAVFDSTPIGVAVWTVEGHLVHANPVFRLLLDDAGPPVLFETLIRPTDAEQVVAALADIWSGDRNYFECDLRCYRPDGDPAWLRAYIAAVYGPEGEPAYLLSEIFSFAESSDGFRQVDESLRLFESLSDPSPVAVLRADTQGRITYLNGRWADLIDAPDAQLPGFAWHDVLRADDVDRIVELGLASVQSRQPFTMRIRPLDRARTEFDDTDQVAWGDLRLAPTYGAAGEHSGFVGIVMDITNEVDAAERADRLATVLDASLDYVLICLPGGAVTYANDAATNSLGVRVSPDDPGGTFLWDLLDSQSTELYLQSIEEALESDGSWRGELTMKSGDAETVPVSVQILAHRRPDGKTGSLSVVARDISDLKAAEAQLRDLATHDRLTGLANRALLYDRIDQALARDQRFSHGVSLMYCDLDEFKPVNDRYGHDAGDAVLTAIAQRIRAVVRETDTAARVGGDEFVVLVEGVRDRQLLETVAYRLIESIAQPVDLGTAAVEVSVSIGLCLAPESLTDADRLMSLADQAMYRAKAAGHGRLEVIAP